MYTLQFVEHFACFPPHQGEATHVPQLYKLGLKRAFPTIPGDGFSALSAHYLNRL